MTEPSVNPKKPYVIVCISTFFLRLTDGVGLIVPPINAEALSVAFKKLSQDSERKIMFSRRGPALARIYDKVKIADDLLLTLVK